MPKVVSRKPENSVVTAKLGRWVAKKSGLWVTENLDGWVTGSLDSWLAENAGCWAKGNRDCWVTWNSGRWVVGNPGCWVTWNSGRWVTGNSGRWVTGNPDCWVRESGLTLKLEGCVTTNWFTPNLLSVVGNGLESFVTKFVGSSVTAGNLDSWKPCWFFPWK
jgi:hypothetical protein